MTDIGSSLTYTLPTSDLPNFDNLFTQLNLNLETLGIAGFGVSDSTLYEVGKARRGTIRGREREGDDC